MNRDKNEVVIGLAGNPNTGKSTVFNALTGLKQHTGNWSGKTVTNAKGSFRLEGKEFTIYDLPGIYSIFSDSAEECCAKEFICFEHPDITIVVLDATCLERNLTLALQVLELTDHVILCLNLMDEAAKKQIHVDVQKLQEMTGVPVLCTSARDGKGIDELKKLLLKAVEKEISFCPVRTTFNDSFRKAVDAMKESAMHLVPQGMRPDFFFSQVIEEDTCFYNALKEIDDYDDMKLNELLARAEQTQKELTQQGITIEQWKREKCLDFLKRAEYIAKEVVSFGKKDALERERRLDSIILSKKIGIPIMLCLLGLIFWITIAGANVPSDLLMQLFWVMGERLGDFLTWCHAPEWLYGLLKDGIFLTVSWVVAVMLPPMAIFFPLFTLLEDFGLLPRIAFNLDGLFQKANAHGKQALTMWIVDCRISFKT